MFYGFQYSYVAISVAFPNPEAMTSVGNGIDNNNRTAFIDVFLHANIL